VAVSIILCSQLPTAIAIEPPRLLTASAAVLQGPDRDRFVAAHNAARKPLALEPLTWSDVVAAEALKSLQEQQETLIRAAQDGWATLHIPLPTHRTDHQYGENIAAWASSSRLPADHAIALWLREKPAFDLLNSVGSYRVGDELPPPAAPAEKQPPPLIVGHYTQIIWRSTRHLGAAQLTFDLADDRSTRHYVAIICNYDPPGNQQGEKPY
jgi:pathogenesis-related protein 1